MDRTWRRTSLLKVNIQNDNVVAVEIVAEDAVKICLPQPALHHTP